MSNSVDEVCEAAEAEAWLPLPPLARRLLTQSGAPPRLVAHLHLVHDVAARLTRQCSKALPKLRVDTDAIAFGAATHDIGKALFPAELSGAGSRHELAGEAWMIAHDIEARLARFARTHGLGAEDEALGLEDLLVITADKLWKGKRVVALEERLIRELAHSTGEDYWDVWSLLNTHFDGLAEDADRRLTWQGRFSPNI